MNTPRTVHATNGHPGCVLTFATMKRWLCLGLFAAVLLLLLPEAAQAQGCAMCKATVESADDTQRLGGGLNKGIIFLMVVPYALLFLLFRKKIMAFVKEFSAAKG